MAANPFEFDVTKFFADFRYKPFDVESVMAAQRRNIEALSQANQAAAEGMQALGVLGRWIFGAGQHIECPGARVDDRR